MITKNAELCIESLEEGGLTFKVHEPESGDTVVELGFSNPNGPYVRFILIYDEDDTAISVRCIDYVNFPAEMTDDIFDMCDEYNCRYRFAKLYVDRDDNTVNAQISTFVTPETVVELTHACLGMLMESVNESYPRFMKAIWSRD